MILGLVGGGLQARAQAAPFDLLLLDGSMPEMDGYEVARRLPADSGRTPAIVFLDSLENYGEAAGEDGRRMAVIKKPVRQSTLLATLIEVLDPASQAQQLQAPQPAPSPMLGARVLLLEDQAVKRLEQERFDLVFMDVQMPVMDCLTATRQIREREATDGTRVPIIAMTAHAMNSDRDLCVAAGMDGYVSKPIRAGEVRAVIERWLAAGSSSD
ncbi:MAG: response regulator [bacterium]|nr:response regulator [bacterium]